MLPVNRQLVSRALQASYTAAEHLYSHARQSGALSSVAIKSGTPSVSSGSVNSDYGVRPYSTTFSSTTYGSGHSNGKSRSRQQKSWHKSTINLRVQPTFLEQAIHYAQMMSTVAPVKSDSDDVLEVSPSPTISTPVVAKPGPVSDGTPKGTTLFSGGSGGGQGSGNGRDSGFFAKRRHDAEVRGNIGPIYEVNAAGGGGKGKNTLLAMIHLNELGYFKDLQAASGTSVGSLFAVILALHGEGDIKELTQVLIEAGDLLSGESAAYSEYLEGLAHETDTDTGYYFDEGGSGIGALFESAYATGKGIYQQGALDSSEKLERALRKIVSILVEKAITKSGYSAEQQQEIRKLFKDISNPTFAELSKAQEAYPNLGFRQLSIMLSDMTNMKAVAANAETMPNVGIVDAAMASSALPGAFPKRIIDGVTYRDGGLLGPNMGSETGKYPENTLYMIYPANDPLQSYEDPFSPLGLLTEFATGTNFVHKENGGRARLERDPHAVVIEVPVKEPPVSTTSMDMTHFKAEPPKQLVSNIDKQLATQAQKKVAAREEQQAQKSATTPTFTVSGGE